MQANHIRVQSRELSKVFRTSNRGTIRAVDRVSFEAGAGEVFCLLGINGAGKTTTLRLLATMLKPSFGDATICGASLGRNPQAVRKHIGFMSTATSLYGRLTAREMVRYFGQLHGLQPAAIQERSQQLFDLFEMNDFLDRRCEQLSSGMKQKVSIARTVLHDPDVIILDEPTIGLDVLTSQTIINFVKACRERNKCVIFSTHIMEEVDKLADRVGIIHNGKLLACEPAEQLRSRVPSRKMEDVFIQMVGATE